MGRSDDDDDAATRVYYQATYGGWTDKTPGMLATGARLHLALGDAIPATTGALTHASFFSGAGGLDLGLERAGWNTLSVSEIDPYASAVLASRWPDVPNLGDIVRLATGARRILDAPGDDDEPEPEEDTGRPPEPVGRDGEQDHGRGRRQREPASEPAADRPDWSRAVLFSGGFPCQDLSVAGKRRGFTGQRSVLAFAFLDLVELYRPPAILLENVPGLLSSHKGRDLATLFGRLVDLGYGVAYRVLDARLFGVPQRRQRVFIVALRGDVDDPDLDLASERAAQVLAVGAFCDRHPPQGSEAGQELARRAKGGTGRHGSAADGAQYTRTLAANTGHHGYALGTQDFDGGYLQVVDGSDDVAATLNSGGNAGGFRTEPGAHLVVGEGRDVTAAVTAKWSHGTGGPAGDEHHDLVYVAAPVGQGDHGRRGAEPDVRSEHDGRRSAGPDDPDDVAPTLRVGAANIRAGGPGDAVPVVVSPAPDAARVREADGLAGRLDDSPGLVGPIFVKSHHAEDADDAETWEADDVGPTLSVDSTNEARVTTLIPSSSTAEDPLLPKGLDSHRYRCCGNGVVTPVAEWLGRRLTEWALEEGYGGSS